MYLNCICSSLSPDTYGDPDITKEKEGEGGREAGKDREGQRKTGYNLSTWQ